MTALTSATGTTSTDLVINFHMTESCNYRCSYCYATWDNLDAKDELHRLSGQVESLIQSLADYFLHPNSLQQEMGYQDVRLNFAGGEPMLLGQRFLDAVRFANQLGFRTSLITNGHYLSDAILDELAPSLGVLGISYDTANHEVAQNIGRIDRKKRWITSEQLAHMCSRYRTLNPAGILKINTVVNAANSHDSLLDLMTQIQPNKWKLLRVLPVHGHQLTITQSEYKAYSLRHAELSSIIVEEDNDAMTHTYLMINPEGRFYQNSAAGCGYSISEPILISGVETALSQIPFDVTGFQQRYQLIPSLNL